MGLPLPNWCSKYHYNKLAELAAVAFEAATEEIIRSLAGPTIEIFLNNIEEQEKGITKVKMYLYGAHDFNVGPFLLAHNVTGVPKIPDFGSAAIVEKRRGIDGKTYIRVRI